MTRSSSIGSGSSTAPWQDATRSNSQMEAGQSRRSGDSFTVADVALSSRRSISSDSVDDFASARSGSTSATFRSASERSLRDSGSDSGGGSSRRSTSSRFSIDAASPSSNGSRSPSIVSNGSDHRSNTPSRPSFLQDWRPNGRKPTAQELAEAESIFSNFRPAGSSASSNGSYRRPGAEIVSQAVESSHALEILPDYRGEWPADRKPTLRALMDARSQISSSRPSSASSVIRRLREDGLLSPAANETGRRFNRSFVGTRSRLAAGTNVAESSLASGGRQGQGSLDSEDVQSLSSSYRSDASSVIRRLRNDGILPSASNRSSRRTTADLIDDLRTSSRSTSARSDLTRDSSGFLISRNSRPTGFLAQEMSPERRQELLELMSNNNDFPGLRFYEEAIKNHDIRSSQKLDDHLLTNYGSNLIRWPSRQTRPSNVSYGNPTASDLRWYGGVEREINRNSRWRESTAGRSFLAQHEKEED